MQKQRKKLSVSYLNPETSLPSMSQKCLLSLKKLCATSLIHDLDTSFKQKLRHQGKERVEVANAEVQKLLKTTFIQEYQYSNWLSNFVLVKKPNGKWRMCVYFTDLNKVCPKDDYLLPKIDRQIDSTAGHALLGFMDANVGYHQIPLAEGNQSHTPLSQVPEFIVTESCLSDKKLLEQHIIEW